MKHRSLTTSKIKRSENVPFYKIDPDVLLNERRAAALLGVTVRALQAWRHRGGGPPYFRIGARTIRYRRGNIMDWLQSRAYDSTAGYS